MPPRSKAAPQEREQEDAIAELAAATAAEVGGHIEDITTEDPPAISVHQALTRVMRECRELTKDQRNEKQGFMFRGIDQVMNLVGPSFRRHGIIATPTVLSTKYERYSTKAGGQATSCRLRCRYTFIGPDGSTIQCEVAGEAADSGDKSTPKAMSVCYRTALLQVLTLPTDERDPGADVFERKDWRKLADDAKSFQQTRALYLHAQNEGAEKGDLEYVFALAESRRQDEETEGTARGVAGITNGTAERAVTGAAWGGETTSGSTIAPDNDVAANDPALDSDAGEGV